MPVKIRKLDTTNSTIKKKMKIFYTSGMQSNLVRTHKKNMASNPFPLKDFYISPVYYIDVVKI